MATYAISDMHGCLKVYEVLKNQILLPEDKVYCLGDCGDRGPEPWNTIKTVAKDPQFIYLKGNHEDMLVKAAREAMDGTIWGSERQRLLISNGGAETLEGLLSEEKVDIWISKIASLPTHIFYENIKGQKIFLSHAGCTFWQDEDVIPISHELLWNRDHYFDNDKLMNETIVVYGHTPLFYVAEDLEIKTPNPITALEHANGKKYCIDAGTFATGYSILFNLDTFQSIIIDIND